MSTSYQDIDSRLHVVEDKIDFIMKQFQVTKRERSTIDPTQEIVKQMNLLDVYREVTTGLVSLERD